MKKTCIIKTTDTILLKRTHLQNIVLSVWTHRTFLLYRDYKELFYSKGSTLFLYLENIVLSVWTHSRTIQILFFASIFIDILFFYLWSGLTAGCVEGPCVDHKDWRRGIHVELAMDMRALLWESAKFLLADIIYR